ncbi:MAG: bifunctional aspartate kinase/homoserine dehydrogenase I [Pseudomonadota bacterium]
MHVLKFGGTSVGSAKRLLECLAIVRDRVNQTRVGIVLSAVSGITNKLDASIQAAKVGADIDSLVDPIASIHHAIIDELALNRPALAKDELNQFLDDICQKYKALLHGIQLINECPIKVYCQILSFGERLSARIFTELLRCEGINPHFIDAADFIKTKGALDEGTPVMEELENRFKVLLDSPHKCILMSGFIASDMDGKLSLLGRNGSDFSGSLMAVGLNAERCEIWTDVDGIYTSDPNKIHDAMLIKSMSYGEAMELAFYGATVLHPKTTSALADRDIPLYIKNTFNPAHPGTCISRTAPADDYLIRAVSAMNNVALINVSGPGMKGMSGIAARIFGTVSKCGVSIALISQSSSEYSICFCVPDKDAAIVQEALSIEFVLEYNAKLIDMIEIISNQSVICIVGDQMRSHCGVAGKFFQALSTASINISAIEQGSSERCISAVINGDQSARAIQSVHRAFFKSHQSIDLYVCGVGSVGSELIDQIAQQRQTLHEEGIDINVCGIANSSTMICAEGGLDLVNWRADLNASNHASVVSAMAEHANRTKPLNGIFVDCTTSEAIGQTYLDIFKAGLHVVTANKKANSSAMNYYAQLRAVADKHKRRFLYETNVGAGLPVIDTLKGLLKSGDKLVEFSGIMSGSMSLICGLLDEGMSFSEAVELARNKKFTEPDPRDDLNGMDVARKVLIVAREAGLQVELDDVVIEPLFPAGFSSTGNVAEFLSNLKTVDTYFAEKLMDLKAENKVLRFVGAIANGVCSVGMQAVGTAHPLYPIKGGENAFAFKTKRYSPIPLVIRGYGAGVEVTAAGLFADILRTVEFN